MESDKEMLRRRNYIEALGDNYTDKPIYAMLFENGECIDQLEERFESKYRALEWLKANKVLQEGQQWALGNINNEWL
jgi:hypothetical protein